MHLLGRPIDKTVRTPAHLQVRNRLLDMIHEGRLRPGDRLPPEPEVAHQLGVSRMTANKAILSLVAEGWFLREKGKGTFVAGVAPGTVSRCAVAIPADPVAAQEDYYFGALFWSLQAELHHGGLEVAPIKLQPGLGEAFTDLKADALIAINPAEALLDDLLACARTGRPVVIVGASWGDYGLSLVDSDNLLGSALAVNHLCDLGHQRIFFLGACPNDSNTIDRIRGYRTALKARQIEVDEAWIGVTRTAFGTDAEVEERLVAALTSERPPTAVFAAGARLAMRVLGLAQKLNLRVPEELSVVAYDDPEFLKLAYPPVTTIRQPLPDMARAACEIVFHLLRTNDPRPVKKVLDPTLVTRATTAPATNRYQ